MNQNARVFRCVYTFFVLGSQHRQSSALRVSNRRLREFHCPHQRYRQRFSATDINTSASPMAHKGITDYRHTAHRLSARLWSAAERVFPIDATPDNSIHPYIQTKKTVLDGESRSDRTLYCDTILIRAGHWPLTLTYNLVFQYQTSYGHDTQKTQVQRLVGSKNRVETSKPLRLFDNPVKIQKNLINLFSPRKRGSMFVPALVCVFDCLCVYVCLWPRWLKKLWTDLYQILCDGS